MRKKAISLISGGLDSILSTKLIMEQGIEVVGFHFTSPFASKRDKEKGAMAVATAAELGIELLTRHKGEDYLEMLLHPKYGYGKNMNPCIDCRIYMLRITANVMEETGASFVATGEVLGQRPMSQRRETMRQIEKESGLDGLIVRPLCAQCFDPTIPEKEGILDRSKLLAITGRGRSPQYELAGKYGLKEFSKPGGGCLLTDPIFAKRFKEFISVEKDFGMVDIDLLTLGRHFRLRPDAKLIVGRNEEENGTLRSLCAPPYVLLSPSGFKGPQAVLKGPRDDEIMGLAANIIGFYAKQTTPTITIVAETGPAETFRVDRVEEDCERFRV